MADVYGRLTGRAGVCMSTLGPGATNLITGVADANMDRAPIVAIAGQGATTRLHKESHQILDLVNMFQPITKYATQILRAADRAGDRAQGLQGRADREARRRVHRLPREHRRDGGRQASRSRCRRPTRPTHAGRQDRRRRRSIISHAKEPIILAGNGVIRQGAADALVSFAEVLRIPVANTFMAKGVMPFTNELSLGTIGLKARDLPWFAFEKADVVICVGYDMVEYHPDMWNPNGDKTIVHIDALPAEVDEHYIVAVGVLGDIGRLAARDRASRPSRSAASPFKAVRKAIVEDRAEYRERHGLPDQAAEDRLGPARGARARTTSPSRTSARTRCGCRACTAPSVPTPASSPTASRRWASRCPGAHRRQARLSRIARSIAVTGDAGFMMNSQEIETALRMKTPFVILIWNDSEYGLITWHQLRHFGRPEPHRVQEPRLREVRRELRRQGLSRRAAREDLRARR